MSISVRALSANDREQWEALYRGYAEFYKMPMEQETLDAVWGWIFDENMPFYCRLSETDAGDVVGMMHFRAMPSPLRGKMTGFLDDLFVLPESRGTGVVEALFAALEAEATDQGWPSVRWITAEDNYRGRAVYDRLATKTVWQTYQLDVGA